MVELGDAPLEIIDGDRGKNYPKQNEFSDSGHCLFLSATNVTRGGFEFSDCQFISEKKDEMLRKGKLRREAVVLTTRGTLGNVAHFHVSVPYEHMRINSGMIILRCNQRKILPAYLYRFLRSTSFRRQVNAMKSGVAQPQLPVRDIKRIKIRLPSLSKQHNVSSVLSTYDDLIENNRRRMRLLEQAARLLYREWFVHLRYPGHEHTTVIDGVPAGWERKNLRTVAEIKGGKQYQGKGFNSSGNVPVFGGNGIQGYSQKRTHNGFVIIFGRVGANCGSIHWSYDGAWVNNNASSIVPNFYDELILQHLLHYDFIHLRKGAAQPFIPNSIISNVKLLIPAEILATKFCKLVGGIRHQQQSLSSQIRLLIKARDVILPYLMDGRVEL